MLRVPDFWRPFIVQTDASGLDLGAVLSQGDYPDEHLILYLSRKLSKVKWSYAVIEREALAIKWAL